MSLFDIFKDRSQAQSLPLLQLTEHDISTRADSNPRWIDDLTIISDVSV